MLKIGSVLDGKYKILSEIGHGGMSVVYMALNEKANKTWAVKEIRKDGKMDFNTVRQGLIAEIETLKKLKHPNLPSIVDIIEDEDTFIIVMDYIEGNSLDRALEEHGAQPQEFVIEWAKQLCDVLGYLHSCDPPIIYRDMKPANIMLKPDGNIALIDFGTAKTYEIDLGETTGIGTIGYAAPEQYIGSGLGRTDARTDIYCLGMTLYHLLTGNDPCKNLISDRSVRAINPSLSPGLDSIIIKATEYNPDDRYQSCAELLYAIEHHTEMGDKYRKRQKVKLGTFICTVVMSIVFAGFSVFGLVSANQKKAENYGVFAEMAANPDLTQAEREKLYLKAIEIDPKKTDAYLSLIDLFLASEENGVVFSKSEAGTIVQLKAGIETKDSSGYSATIYPLDELKRSNPEGFAEVCNEIGFAYWYDYEIESERYTSAVEWFENAVEYFPLAQSFCDIGECRAQIKKYRNQKRTEKMYDAYKTLWDKMQVLYEDTKALDDNDMKLLVWSEIVYNISEETEDFLVSVPQENINSLLNSISVSTEELKKSATLKTVRETAEKVISDVDNAKQRITVAGEAKREEQSS